MTVTLIDCRYVLMAEPDHIFLTPMPNLVHDQYPVAFKFFYIEPLKHEKIIRKYFPKKMGPVTNVDPIGNSPVMIRKVMMNQSIELLLYVMHILFLSFSTNDI